MFFKAGPSTRYTANKKLKSESEKFQGEIKQKFSYRHGESYNENLDTLVQLGLLSHEEFHKELLNIKHPDLEQIESKLRKLVRKAFQNRDYGCPPRVDKKRWQRALDAYRLANFNERVEGKIGESLYRLTIWGVISHLRNEDKLPSGQIIIRDYRIHSDLQNLKSKLTYEDLDKILPHLRGSEELSIIERKWKYLHQNNLKEIVYHQLHDLLTVANYYYEWYHADFARFKNSAMKDFLLHFLLPYTLNQPYADNWIKSLVKDREIFDLLMGYFAELKQYFKSLQDIINEYDKILKKARKNGIVAPPKFLKDNDFWVKRPSYFGHGYYLGMGPWGYRLSYFLHELDSGQIEYTWSLMKTIRSYRTKQNRGTMKTLTISTAEPKEKGKFVEKSPRTTIEMS